MTSFNKISDSSRAWTIFMTSFIFSFEIIKVGVPEPCIFFWIPASIAEAASVIHNGAKIFFAKGTATFISGPVNLFNSDPKNPPDWIILEIWAFESLKSVGILLLNAFLSFAFCLFVKNNSWGWAFPSSIFKFTLKVALFCFWQQFLVFSVAYLLVLHSFYWIQTFIYRYNTFVVPL